MKHTEGPWELRYEGDPTDKSTMLSVHAGGYIVANSIWGPGAGGEERLANAALIASAPELYQAIQDAYALTVLGLDHQALINRLGDAMQIPARHREG